MVAGAVADAGGAGESENNVKGRRGGAEQGGKGGERRKRERRKGGGNLKNEDILQSVVDSVLLV